MDINTVKSVFGAMPVSQLTAAQLLAKKKKNQVYLIGGAFILVGVGIYLGIKYEKSRNRRLELKNSPSKSLGHNYIPQAPLNQKNSIVSRAEQSGTEESSEPVVEESEQE